MQSTAAQIAIRLVLCGCAVYPLWRWLGPIGLALGAPLLGVALARPIIDVAADGYRLIRMRVFRPLEGVHFAYRGVSVEVIEDESHCRWTRLVDLRKIARHLPGDPVFEKLYPDGFRLAGRPPSGYLDDEALLHYLGKASTPEMLRLRLWVERVVAFPARRQRQRHGIRSPAATDE